MLQQLSLKGRNYNLSQILLALLTPQCSLLGKSIADATGVTDAYALTVATVFADSAGITDSVSTVASFVRAFDDTVNFVDSISQSGTGQKTLFRRSGYN